MFSRLRSKLIVAGRLVRDLADPAIRRNAHQIIRAYRLAPDFECPCCSYRGRFDSAGDTNYFNSDCPACHAKERHRLVALAQARGFLSFAAKDILHFAPEPPLRALISAARPRSYASADLRPGAADLVVDIEDPHLPDASFDMIICSHVLEHVDDRRALAAIHRLLRPGGEAVLMVPLVEGWETTFEDGAIVGKADRHRNFLQFDHVRIYGADFRERVVAGGFLLEEYGADGRDCARFGLLRGEKVFRALRPARAAPG